MSAKKSEAISTFYGVEFMDNESDRQANKLAKN